MKKKLYFRILSFILVFLVMFTTFIISFQQIRAETTAEADTTTESITVKDDQDTEFNEERFLGDADEGIDSSIESTELQQIAEESISENTNEYKSDVTATNLDEPKSKSISAEPLSEYEFDPITGTITKYLGSETVVTIPAIIDDVTVEIIGDSAFEDKQLTEVILPDSIIKIENNAFDCNQLSSIIIPEGVIFIGACAFRFNKLESIKIPDNVTEIGKAAFSSNKLSSITFPNGITKIGDYLFSNNELSNLIIPDSVTEIGDGSFSSNELSSIEFNDEITKIGDYTFEANKLTNVEIPESISIIGNYTFASNLLEELIIPDNIIKIGDNAFQSNQLTNITIGDHVTTIGSRAFNSNQLSSLIIPDSVTEIGEAAFSFNQLTSLIIPNKVTEIGEDAFSFNKLQSLEFLNRPTSIKGSTFAFNELTEITIPDSVIEIEWGAFANNQLISVEIPDKVTIIGWRAFGSNKLTSVRISDSVTEIGVAAFRDNQLASVDIPDSVTEIGWRVFQDNLLVEVSLPASVTEIGAYAFASNKLTSLPVLDNVTSIGAYAFEANDLTSITIPSNVTNIGEGAFKSNELRNVIIPNNVLEIGRETFAQNPVREPSIPNSITAITELDPEDNTVVFIPNPTIEQILEHCFDPGVSLIRYIKAGSIIRETPDGTEINRLWRPIRVTGTIQGAWLKFTYNGSTAYVAMSVATTSNPPMTGYAKQTLNLRDTPKGSIIGTIPRGIKVSGVLVGNMVKTTYKGKTGYVYATLLQKDPVEVTRYIKANSIIRSTPNGSIITRLWRPIRVTGTIQGAWLKFTYNGSTAYVAMSITTTSNPPMTGYAKQTLYMRDVPGGSVIGTIPIDRQVSGNLFGNMVKTTYNGKTGYVYATLLQKNPVKVTRYIKANSIIRSTPNGSIITRLWRPIRVTGTIQGAWLKFTYNSKTAYAAMRVTTTSNPPMTGYAKQTLNLRNTPKGSIIGTIPRGVKVSGVLVGNMVKTTYKGKTGYVYATLLQKKPVEISGYASQKLNVRSYSDSSKIIGKIAKGRQVSGQVTGNLVVFTYNGTKATVYRSLVSTKPVTYTGYVLANAKIHVKPNGSSCDEYKYTNDIQGIWEGDWLKTDDRGDTGYVYKSNIKDSKPSSYGVSYIASYGVSYIVSYGSTVTTEYKNALAEANKYLEIFDLSKQRLYEQLISPHGGEYSLKAAQYAVENCGANWRQNSVKSGRGYLEIFNW